MRTQVAITGFGYCTETGFGGTGGVSRTEAIRIEDLKWGWVSQEPFRRFGRIDAPSKCAVVAAELSRLDEVLDSSLRPRTAISMGTDEGCLGADLDFAMEIGSEAGPSPRHFTYTVPSVASGEIAIRYGLRGPNVCFVAGRQSGLLALWEGFYSVLEGEADACVCLEVNALSPSSASLAAEKSLANAPENFSACVFILEAMDNETEPDQRILGRLTLETDSMGRSKSEVSSLEKLHQFLEDVSEADSSSRTIESPHATGTDRILVVQREKSIQT